MMIRLLAVLALLSLVACGEPESISGQWKLTWVGCKVAAGFEGDLNIGSDDHFVGHYWQANGYGEWMEGDLMRTSDNQWQISSVIGTACNADQSECQSVPIEGGASFELSDDGKLRLISQCPMLYVR